MRFARHPLSKMWDSYVAFHTIASDKLFLAGIIGMIGFPTFYLLYTFVTPQPYESLIARGTGFMLSAGLVLARFFPEKTERFLPFYSYLAFLIALPTFFVFMTLMNDASTIWQVSTMAAFVYVALLYDSVNMVFVSVVGAILGVAAYLVVSGGAPFPEEAIHLLPIVAFALVGFAVLNYSESRVVNEKMRAASQLAGHIAHEMRTPLLGISLDAERVDERLPDLTEAAVWAHARGFEGRRLGQREARNLVRSMSRIKDHTLYANMIIDMLLMNAGRRKIAQHHFDIFSARETIANAIERYHFRPNELTLVTIADEDDFYYLGSDILLVHTLFNLLKNSLRAIESAALGAIEIRLDSSGSANRIIFTDTGPGIPPSVLSRIFIPFYSGEKHGEGTGIGLAFSRFVIDSFGGEMTCHSTLGQGTTFEIALPRVNAEAIANARAESSAPSTSPMRRAPGSTDKPASPEKHAA
ncbi:MAG: HAMP domain-containing sensor histidine kinase [Pseudomonadota bacterium]